MTWFAGGWRFVSRNFSTAPTRMTARKKWRLISCYKSGVRDGTGRLDGRQQRSRIILGGSSALNDRIADHRVMPRRS